MIFFIVKLKVPFGIRVPLNMFFTVRVDVPSVEELVPVMLPKL